MSEHDHMPITNGDEPAALRARALEELLVEKGVLRAEEIHAGIDWLVSRTPADGARLVARAWVDPEFKQRLLADARAAALELGLDPGPSPVVVAFEFGMEISDDVQLRVLDSAADIHYLVIPRRPQGTSELSEEQLAALVTRDSMIGVAQPAAPALA